MSRLMPSGLILFALLVLTINVQAQMSSTGAASTATGVISGRVTSAGQPVPIVAIILEPFDLSSPKSRLPAAITNGEGKYRLTGVPEGRYTVKTVAPALVVLSGPDSDKAGTPMSSGVGLSGFVVTVTKGDVLEGIDFALGAGGVITGRVTDDAGRPVVAVTVESDRLGERGQSTGAALRFPTDDRGIYRIYGLPAGKYIVSVSDFGGYPPRRDRRTFYPDIETAPSRSRSPPAASRRASTFDSVNRNKPTRLPGVWWRKTAGNL